MLYTGGQTSGRKTIKRGPQKHLQRWPTQTVYLLTYKPPYVAVRGRTPTCLPQSLLPLPLVVLSQCLGCGTDIVQTPDYSFRVDSQECCDKNKECCDNRNYSQR